MNINPNDRRIKFSFSAGLQSVYLAACDFSTRLQHRFVQPCDLLLALYYAGDAQTSGILHCALSDQRQLDAAVLEHHNQLVTDEEGQPGISVSTERVLRVAAELALHCRGVAQPGEAVISPADLGVALLNEQAIRDTLKAAGLSEFQLRHLEEAMRFQEKLPPLAVHDATAAMPGLQ